MILEVGAGGCIMITPPAKGSKLEKSMGSVIDLGDGCSVYRSERSMAEKKDPITVAFESAPVDDYVRYPTDVPMRDEDGDIVIKGDVHSYSIVYKHRRGDIVLTEDGQPLLKSINGYRRHKTDVYAIDAQGKIATDANGNKIVKSRAGDIEFNDDGEPLKDWKSLTPRVVFDGIRHGTSFPVYRWQLDDVRYLSGEDLATLYDEVSTEVRRRVLGGQPLSYDNENNPTVASI